MRSLPLRALFFVLLLPGTVAGYVPLRILHDTDGFHAPQAGATAVFALLLVIAGTAVVARCVWDFFAAGHGTLAPIDPPTRLVVCGLYRYTRNPMYNGVIAIVLGEMLFYESIPVLRYLLGVIVAFNIMVMAYEEPTLAARFGEAYRQYRSAVPRWGFTIQPFRFGSKSTAT
jgi:protein-S-isoprenylcysteine O-methyltransferase Ste14